MKSDVPTIESLLQNLHNLAHRLSPENTQRPLLECGLAALSAEPAKTALSYAYQKLVQARGNRTAQADLIHAVRTVGILVHEFGVASEDLVVTAILHDVLNESEAEVEEVESLFGEAVADHLVLLTPPRFFPKAERQRLYEEGLLMAPERVLLVKLAEVYDEISFGKMRRQTKQGRTFSLILQHVARKRALHTETAKAIGMVMQLLDCPAIPLQSAHEDAGRLEIFDLFGNHAAA